MTAIPPVPGVPAWSGTAAEVPGILWNAFSILIQRGEISEVEVPAGLRPVIQQAGVDFIAAEFRLVTYLFLTCFLEN